MEPEFFSGDKCTVWLVQMAWAHFSVIQQRYFDQDTRSVKLNAINDDLIIRTTTLSISVLFLTLYYIVTSYQKQKIGYSHLLLTIWTLIQVLPIIALYHFARIRPMKDYDDSLRIVTEYT